MLDKEATIERGRRLFGSERRNASEMELIRHAAAWVSANVPERYQDQFRDFLLSEIERDPEYVETAGWSTLWQRYKVRAV